MSQLSPVSAGFEFRSVLPSMIARLVEHVRQRISLPRERINIVKLTSQFLFAVPCASVVVVDTATSSKHCHTDATPDMMEFSKMAVVNYSSGQTKKRSKRKGA